MYAVGLSNIKIGAGFCDNTVPSISDVFGNADVSLFKTVLKNNNHVLYPYLPENQYQHSHLRQRPHNKALIPKTTYLSDRDFIMRMLYKNCYQPTVTPWCGTVITHCAYVVCYFRDVHFFINFIIAMYVHLLGLYRILLRGFSSSII